MKKETRKFIGMVVSVVMATATAAKCCIDAIKLKSEINKTKAETAAINAGIDKEPKPDEVEVSIENQSEKE